MIKWTHYGEEYTGRLLLQEYANGALAVRLMCNDYETYAVLSVNVPGMSETLDGTTFVAKTYSENEGLVEQLIEQGVFQTTGCACEVGRAGPQPILRVHPVYLVSGDSTIGKG